MVFKSKIFSTFLIIAAFFFLSAPASAYAPGEPCGVALDGLSKTSGQPGDTFEMRGRWDTAQEMKLPSINKGGQKRLEVISWTPSVLTVRIPENLSPGKYRVGVYCNDPGAGTKGTYSSGWMDFDVTAAVASAQSPQPDARPLLEPAVAPVAAPAVQPPPSPAQPRIKDTPKTSDVERMLSGIAGMDFGNFTLQVIVAIAAIVIISGMILWLKQAMSFDVKVDFKFSQKTRTQATPMPDTGLSNAPQPQAGRNIPDPFSGTVKGVAYAVESLDSETMTVHIEIPKLLPKRFDFFTDEMPKFDNTEMESEVNALVRLGAVYIDVSGNTTWVAALFPFDVNVDKRLAEEIAAHLIKLRDLCSK